MWFVDTETCFVKVKGQKRSVNYFCRSGKDGVTDMLWSDGGLGADVQRNRAGCSSSALSVADSHLTSVVTRLIWMTARHRSRETWLLFSSFQRNTVDLIVQCDGLVYSIFSSPLTKPLNHETIKPFSPRALLCFQDDLIHLCAQHTTFSKQT